MIKPRSVAVTDASSDPTRIGSRPITYVLCRGYAGQILPVDPSRAEIRGLPALVSITELPQTLDVAIIMVPTPQVLKTVRTLGRQRARSVIVSSSGFSEVGEVGAAMQDTVVTAIRERGMRLLGPDTLGAFNNNLGYYAFFSANLEHGVPLPDRVGVATQPGAYGTHLLGIVRQRHPGTLICTVTGNEAGVILDDSISWLAESPEIDVVTVYAESIRNVDSFLTILEAAYRTGKSVILHKVGRDALDSRAALFHTTSLAGDDEMLDAVLGDYTVTRVRTTEELVDIAYLVTRRIYPVGSNSGTIIVSGDVGITVSNVIEEVGLPVPPMPGMAQEWLKARLSFASSINPVDCTAQTLSDLTLVRNFTEPMMVDGGYRLLLAFFTQVGTATPIGACLVERFRRIKEAHPERLSVVLVMGEGEELAPCEEAGFALLEGLTRAAVAIQAMGWPGEAFAQPLRLHRPIDGLQLSASTPGKVEAKHLLARAGIESAAEAVLGNAEKAVAFAEDAGYPVVLKLVSAGIQRKSEIGGVLLGISGADAVRAGFQLFLHRTTEGAPQARLDGVLVTRQLQGKVKCFTGIQRDLLFGPVALFGLGGIFVEVLQDVAFHRCPFEVDEAEAVTRSVRGAPFPFGARGRSRTDVAALARLLLNLSRFAWEVGERLYSVDLNPIIVLPEGQGAQAVDAVLEVGGVADGARS